MMTIARGPRAFPARGFPTQSCDGIHFGSRVESRRGEFAGRSPPHGRYEARRDGRSLSLRGTTDHVFPLVVLVVLR